MGHGVEPCREVTTDYLVRVFTLWQSQHVDLCIDLFFQSNQYTRLLLLHSILLYSFCRQRYRYKGMIECLQCLLDSMLGGCTPRCIRVESERYLLRELFELLNVLLGNRASDTSYRLFGSILMGNDCINIPFYYNNLPCLLYCISRHIYGIQDATFLE